VRARALLPPLALLALAACAPKPPPSAVQLNCQLPYETLKTQILAQPGLDAKPVEPGDPYRAYSLDDGRVSYMLTEPGAPAHPAILMQEAGGGTVKNSGCGYGDKAAYGELVRYLTGLRAALHRS
jgi:hypothetical protein